MPFYNAILTAFHAIVTAFHAIFMRDFNDVALFRRHRPAAVAVEPRDSGELSPLVSGFGFAGGEAARSRAASKGSVSSRRAGGWWEEGGLERERGMNPPRRGESREVWEEELALELGASVSSEDWRHRLLFNEPIQSRLLSHNQPR